MKENETEQKSSRDKEIARLIEQEIKEKKGKEH